MNPDSEPEIPGQVHWALHRATDQARCRAMSLPVRENMRAAVYWPVNQTVRACAGFVVHWAVWEILHGTRGSAAHQALEEVRRDHR